MFFFQLNFSFPLFLCMLVYGNVRKNKGKLKFNCNMMNWCYSKLAACTDRKKKRGDRATYVLEPKFFKALALSKIRIITIIIVAASGHLMN